MITADDMILFHKLRDEDDIGSFYLCDTQAIKVLAEYRESIRAEARAEALMKVEDLIHKWWFDDGDSIETLIKAIKELKP
jgi:hypothetical protein